MNELIIDTDGAVRTLTLNRPQSRNGLTPSLATALAEAVETASGDPDVRCVVLTGAGRAFCSGADLAAAGDYVATHPHDEIIRTIFHRVVKSVVFCNKPVVASIRGGAVGFGFDLALACDLRIASRRSKLGQVFTRIGLVPDGGSSWTLSRLVGVARAMEIALLAETFDGDAAAAMGIVNRVVDDEVLEAETAAVAQRLAAGPPIALRLAKANINAGCSGSFEQALEREVQAQVECLSTEDAKEGIAAFFQKRTPNFEGV